jgi:hypothetical protein
MQKNRFTDVEAESIVLFAIWDMIANMVNYEFFCKLHKASDTNLLFSTATHARLFNVLLGDFLSQPREKGGKEGYFNLKAPGKNARATDYTYLFYLRNICAKPLLGRNADAIQKPLDELARWLEEECVAEKTWFPSIGVEADVRVARIRYIKICGDIAKHNFSRLESNVSKIISILKDSGVTIDVSAGFKALPDFFNRFHTDIFIYHSSHIAQLLNDLLWGIYSYLRPEFQRSCELVGPVDGMYRFNYPENCNHPLARTMYWELMNYMKRKPYLPIFTISESMKACY